ncbi:MAG TPA: Asp/Glu racemase, partial [Amycolatopsis sp.]|nr:Asp/Glu racemase [Amycolatopsis sp.]
MTIPGPEPQIGLGVIAPPDFTRDRELWRWVPGNVTLFVSRTGPVEACDNLAFNQALAHPDVLTRPAREVRTAGAGAIAFACTACSFVRGPDAERALRDAMGTDLPTVTAAGATVQALDAVEARRIAVVHPYAPDVAVRLASFLTAAGFDVVSTKGVELRHSDVTYTQVSDLVTRSDSA